mmetsp:Transcript_30511/g.97346  ORF Transcript_30511/g.97346 Transcript_30511/m.97346 type:complete len:211 (-) Transcript_30511:72-704(-)
MRFSFSSASRCRSPGERDFSLRDTCVATSVGLKVQPSMSCTRAASFSMRSDLSRLRSYIMRVRAVLFRRGVKGSSDASGGITPPSAGGANIRVTGPGPAPAEGDVPGTAAASTVSTATASASGAAAAPSGAAAASPGPAVAIRPALGEPQAQSALPLREHAQCRRGAPAPGAHSARWQWKVPANDSAEARASSPSLAPGATRPVQRCDAR